MSEEIADILEQAKRITEEMTAEECFRTIIWDNEWDDLSSKQAVYVIKEQKPRFYDGKVFYVGKSTELGYRLVRHFRGDSSLRKKLEKNLPVNEFDNYFNNDCVFATKSISDYDMLGLVETLLIKFYRDCKCPLLNEFKP